MEKQIITNSITSVKISKQDALKLELEINLYINKDFWTDIGDKLYDFHTKDINLPFKWSTVMVNQSVIDRLPTGDD